MTDDAPQTPTMPETETEETPSTSAEAETPASSADTEGSDSDSQVWDPEKDPVCVDITDFFLQNPGATVSQKSELIRDGKTIHIGKTMYTLRSRSRQQDVKPLTQARLDALKCCKEFQQFLKQPSHAKPKPTTEVITGIQTLKRFLGDINVAIASLHCAYFQNMCKAASSELEIAKAKRQCIR